MKFSLWTQYGALNSAPVFDAFRQGAHCLGFKCIENSEDADVDVIWSVLFNGRMAGNKAIWERNSANSKPTIVLEVGGINRGTTWKVGLNGINRDAYFGPNNNNSDRYRLLGLSLKPWKDAGKFILICGQHDKSLQWQNMPRMSNWFLNTYDEIRKHTERPILFRPHPRCRLEHIERGLKNVHRQEPVKIGGSYDDFDMKFKNIHATISYSSNPGIHSILNGVPAFVGTSSLAYDVGNDIDFMHDIEAPFMPDRTQWLNDYAHTEWTTQEISQGIPLNLLTDKM
tara:strand:- start:1394 stop:2245 length:852 start_codon:yes stop_codon:yes gene_type:complete